MTKAAKAVRAKQLAFLAVYRECASVTLSASAAKIARRTHYKWLETYPAYVEEFADAQDEACEVMEAEARRRAVAGVDKPVWYQGVQVGAVREYSDSLLMFMLKGAKPETYKDRSDIRLKGQLQHTGSVQIYVTDNGRNDYNGNRSG